MAHFSYAKRITSQRSIGKPVLGEAVGKSHVAVSFIVGHDVIEGARDQNNREVVNVERYNRTMEAENNFGGCTRDLAFPPAPANDRGGEGVKRHSDRQRHAAFENSHS